jgi:polyisoprenoid-binding protein YceI
MTFSRIARAALPAAFCLGLLGCEDPAADKPKATVSSAAPTTTAAPARTTSAATSSATSAAASKPASGDAFTIDPAASKVGFVGSKVTGKHEGTFSKVSGTVTPSGGKAEGGSVTIEIDLDSVKTDDQKLDAHLKSPDFFDVAKHPKATFTSSEIKAGGDKGATHTVTGELDLHGTKKTISFPATIQVGAEDATANAGFSINRKDFGIVYAGMKDDLIRDDVLIKLSVKAEKPTK